MANASFHKRAGRHSGLPENLHFYFIVRKPKWMNLSVNDSKCGSKRNKGRVIDLNWDMLRGAIGNGSGKAKKSAVFTALST